MKKYALVLAAGRGTRMKSETPKVIFPILRKPMIKYISEQIEKSVIDETILVVGYKKEAVKNVLGDSVHYVEQHEQLGTGHAALQAKDYLMSHPGNTFIMPGDVPLIYYKDIDKFFALHDENGNDFTVITTIVDKPEGYGRIIRNKTGTIQAIIEERDCNEYQRTIKEINTGIYIVNNEKFFPLLEQLGNQNAKGEYYITDMVELMKKKYKVGTYMIKDTKAVMGVNDLYAISVAERYLREYINKEHMLNGVYMVNPETITIGDEVMMESGVTILPNTTITGKTCIKSGSVIGPNTEIHASTIGKDVKVKHSLVYDSVVGDETTVGPFAHLRDHANVGTKNRIGNFVEVKNSTTGYNTKASHLSYIGDAEFGEHVNFGCGSVTVNYDGVNKHKTVVGDHAFIGCNTNLIAPVSVGANVLIAAGSTVTEDIPDGAMAIARSRQVTKEDYAKHLIKPKNTK